MYASHIRKISDLKACRENQIGYLITVCLGRWIVDEKIDLLLWQAMDLTKLTYDRLSHESTHSSK